MYAYVALVLFAAAATLLAALRLTTNNTSYNGESSHDSETSSSSGNDSLSADASSEALHYIALVLTVALPIAGLVAGRFGVAHLQRRFKVD